MQSYQEVQTEISALVEAIPEGETQTLQAFTKDVLEKLSINSITSEFFHWSVNGKIVKDPQFKISKKDTVLVIPQISGGK